MNQFFEVLEKSELLSPTALDEARRACAKIGDSAAIAKRLVETRLLTPFQANQIGSARYRGFFIADKYKILDILGEGGMGRVLLCEHLLMRRLVAVKLMHAETFAKNPSAVERFLREARAAASLNHPNIAQVFDVDQSERGPYIVMEVVDGIDLHRYTVKHGPLPPAAAAAYVRQAAVGLQHAHEAGLVHRDVKPVNLMLDRTGTIKLLDLGLAKFFNSEKDDKLTEQHDVSAVIGTADFIAPEQVLESSAADIRADIYSLGLTLYFLLARKLPFGAGKAIQKLVWHQIREPEPIQSIRPEVPDELAAVLTRMIKKNPEERYATPAEVVAALTPFAAGTAAPNPDSLPRAAWTAYRVGLTRIRTKASSGTENESFSTVGMESPANRLIRSSAADPTAAADTRAPRSMTPPASPRRSSSDETAFSDVKPVVTSAPPKKPAAPASPYDDWLADELPSVPAPPRFNSPTALATGAGGSTRWGSVGRRPWLWSAVAAAILAMTVGGVFWAVRQRGDPGAAAAVGRTATDPAATGPSPAASAATTSGAADPAASIAPAGQAGPVLLGGGSTFVRPIMDHWAELYQRHASTHIEYKSVGSSKGIEGVTAKLLDFGCTDAFLTDEQLQAAGGGLVHIPLVLGAVVPTYNVPLTGAATTPLRFTGPVLANIYLGRITNWNDPAIGVNNPGLKLPDLPITVVYRSDGSGTSSIWTDYLCKASAAWKEQVGAGTKVTWPVGVGAEKNDGVADTVSRTVGAIGYVELSFALANGQPFGQVKNTAGVFVTPAIESVTAAAAGALDEIPADLRFSLTDAPGAASYPIVGTCWAVLFVDQPGGKREELLKFLRWATGEGQAFVSDLRYAPLPDELAARVQGALDRVEKGK